MAREHRHPLSAACLRAQPHVDQGHKQRLFQEAQVPFWERYADHDGIRFAINDQNPVVAWL